MEREEITGTSPNVTGDPEFFRFEGEVPMQTGHFVVLSSVLNADGEATGGGVVATFNDWDCALACFNQINEWNPNFEPRIWYDGVDQPIEFLLMDTTGSSKKLQNLIDQVVKRTSSATDDEDDTNNEPPPQRIENHLLF